MAQNRIDNNQAVYTSGIFLVVLIAVFFIFSSSITTESQSVTEANSSSFNAYKEVDLEAQSVYVWDVSERRMLFGRNIDEIRPLASLSKVMTALVAHEVLGGQQLRISAEDLLPEGNSGLNIGDVWDVDDLIDYTLVVSSNDGARALANALESTAESEGSRFIDDMNKRAHVLGLARMAFTNPSGLDAPDLSASGGYGTVRDVVHLVDYIVRNHPTLLEATQEDRINVYSLNNAYEAENTNVLVNEIPFLIASKTGYTDLAGGNLVVAFDVGVNRPIIIGVLGSSKEGRFRDVEALYHATIDYITKN